MLNVKVKIKNNVTFINTISSIISQFFVIALGFIIPKIILTYFGSNVNGLVSSISKFLGYISLLEGGVTGVIMSSLYKPLVEKDNNKISAIIKTADDFYKKIAYIFIGYTLLLALVYPLIFDTEFSYVYVFSLTIILSFGLFIQYNYALSLKTLLTADKKIYIVSFTQIFIILLTIIFTFISVNIYPNIHILKLISGVLFLLQPIIYNFFVKKYYKIDKKVNKDTDLLKSRWSGFAINIAAFIHYSTDIAILSLFTNFTTVSVYSVYSLVINGIRQLIVTISNSINPTIGQIYASGNKLELNEKFNIYEFLIFFIVFFLHSVAILLIVPFVMIYTKNITDTNYYQPLFGILLLLSEAFYLIKLPHLNLAYSANKFKEITIPCYIEAAINIIVSVLLVHKFGLIGVAVGTICAMIYRMIFQVYYTNKIIQRPQLKFYSKFFVFTISTIIGLFLCYNLMSTLEFEIISWILHGIIYSVILLVVYLMTSFIFYKEELSFFINKIKK